MADRTPDPNDAAPAAPTTTRSRRRWKWPVIILGTALILPTAAILIWSWFSLTWTYSAGDRAGYVQKFSKKGWICKTWEGELAMVNIPGATQERWQFSVREDSVAHVIQRLMGKQVSLTYEEHPSVPTSCFAETRYFVVGARPVQ
jgi:hypothetical protein